MEEETNFYDEARRLGIDTQSDPNEYWKPETVRGFMVGDSGPYVDALDYLWLLDRNLPVQARASQDARTHERD